MVSLRLRDFWWNGATSLYEDSGWDWEFNPGPKSITKSVDVQWRVAHRGRRKLKKAKFRVRETITWTIQGSCQGSYTTDALANQIEFYSKRNSKYLIINDSNTPHILLCPDPTAGDTHTFEIVFVVFKSVKFTQTEGKIGWLDYTIELERVNCESISGYTDPWTCT